ncbi:MAG: NifB/NifX family molybdenum-iron cluster-binding protein [Chloroflexota bacterium]
MKLAISISGKTLDSPFDARFGRAAAFCIVDSVSGEWQVIDNPAISASGGAGVQAAQFVASHGVQAVISGAFGPNAYNTLVAADIEMYITPRDQAHSAAEILKMFKDEKLTQVKAATNKGHHGENR